MPLRRKLGLIMALALGIGFALALGVAATGELVQMGVFVLLVLLVAGPVTRRIAAPIERLARAVETISVDQDYAVRVDRLGDDEVGRITDGINEMLRQIRLRDDELASYREHPAQQVRGHTVELVAARNAAGALQPPSPLPPLPLFSARVLLVEDQVTNAQLATVMLEELGLQVEVACDGQAGVAAALTGRHDLVLMDCQMPGMDGFEATAEIRRHEAGGVRRLPVIALTAEGDRQRCLAAGMDDYLSKPYSRVQLVTLLARWLPMQHIAAPSAGQGTDEAEPV